MTYRTPTDSTVYVGGVYEKKADGSVTKYYTALGKTIAMRSSSVAACASTPCYLLTDHLGSASTITDSVGTVVSSQKYWPFGATRSGAISQTDKLYTGQQQEPGDSALGLYNYKARFYSTTLGRFVSVDPIGGAAGGNPQAWNPYSYVRNNPVRYTDPTGMITDTEGDLKNEQYALRRALEALAAAQLYSEQAVERAWASAVPDPAPPCYDCAQAVAEQSGIGVDDLGVDVSVAESSGSPGNRPSTVFGVPVKCCVVVGIEVAGNVAGPGASGNGNVGVYSDSEDRTAVGAGVSGGGGASSRGGLGLSGNFGVGGKLGWSSNGSSAFADANGDAGFCVGDGASVCLGVGFADGGAWFEYSGGLGINQTGPLPVSFYGTGGWSWLSDKLPW